MGKYLKFTQHVYGIFYIPRSYKCSINYKEIHVCARINLINI